MTQGTHNSQVSRLRNIVDLDELLAKRSLAPVPVKLGGFTYNVRTDLTSTEAGHVLTLMSKQLDAQAWTIIVGTKAERTALVDAILKSEQGEKGELPTGKAAAKLDAYLDTLPRIHMALAMSRIMHSTRVLAQHYKSEADVYAEYGIATDDESENEDLEPADQGESTAS